MLFFVTLWLVFLVAIMDDSEQMHLEWIEYNDHWWNEFEEKAKASK